MKQIKLEKITAETFAPFGSFSSMTQPDGYALEGEIHCFFPDRMTMHGNCNMAYSPILVEKKLPRIVKAVEYHTTTSEMILPMNDDMIIHVAPATAGTLVPELTKAFLVPMGTMVKINTAIWHLAPLPANKDVLQAMIILPECIYMNDCTVVDLPEEMQFEIIE